MQGNPHDELACIAQHVQIKMISPSEAEFLTLFHILRTYNIAEIENQGIWERRVFL